MNAIDSEHSGLLHNDKRSIMLYLAPAMTLILGVLIYSTIFPVSTKENETDAKYFTYISEVLSNMLNSFGTLKENLDSESSPFSWIIAIVFAIALYILTYTIGQIITLLSHIIFDRFLLDRCLGFPFEWILFNDSEHSLRKKIFESLSNSDVKTVPECAECIRCFSESDGEKAKDEAIYSFSYFIKELFTIGKNSFRIYVVTKRKSIKLSRQSFTFIVLMFASSLGAYQENHIGLSLFFSSIAALAFLIKIAIIDHLESDKNICAFSELCVEKIGDDAIKFYLPIIRLSNRISCLYTVYYYVTLLVHGIVKVPVMFFLTCLHIKNPFSSDVSNDINNDFKRVFGHSIYGVGTNAYWLPRIFMEINFPQISTVLDKLQERYLFARNMAGAFLILLILGIYLLPSLHITDPRLFFIFANIFLLLAFIGHFFHLYSNRHGRYLFRSFMIASHMEQSTQTETPEKEIEGK